MPRRLTAEVAIVGGGPAGLTAAIALASAGVETALIARRPAPDHRTTALLAGSVTALETLGIWPGCVVHAAPMHSMRIVDATQRLVRAPEVCFKASEIGLDAFGHNIENHHLLAALVDRTKQYPPLLRIEDAATAVRVSKSAVEVTLQNGDTVTARDGRRSRCRASAGIETDGHRYPQTALTFNVSHARSHQNTSTEFHTES